MRFRKIKFHNYRCFCNNEVVFKEKKGRNINILVGPNGGGKTELLFSFWWVLYGFDFSELMGKQDTPYPLNSDLYKKLELAQKGETEKCSVSLELENDDKIYLVEKTCIYKKNEQKIKYIERQSLATVNENGETSLPIEDMNEIDRVLNKIIPKSVLYGILFDGERMQKLSSPDKIAKNAIEGVITDITNVSLINNALSHFQTMSSEISKESKRIAKKHGDYKLEEIITDIQENEAIEQELIKSLNSDSDELAKSNSRIEEISSSLKRINEIRDDVLLKEKKLGEVENCNIQIDTLYKNFSSALSVGGYILRSEDMLSQIQEQLEDHNIPEGLTVSAVKSILSKQKCICGHELHDEEIKILTDLIDKLPPDNINSTLNESIRHSKNDIVEKRDALSKDYNKIIEEENRRAKLKQEITDLSTKIGEFDNEEAQALNNENNNLQQKIGALNSKIESNNIRLISCQDKLEKLRNLRDTFNNTEKDSNYLLKQQKFVDKSLMALKQVNKSNKDKALDDINDSLTESYKLLSEDAERGRQIYIIKYDKSRQFQMVVYLQANYDKIRDRWMNDGTYTKYVADNLSESEIKEKIIIQCIDSSSTGQSKMNTLSFVKAILDYSNKTKDDAAEFSIKKSYPFLIDAPFGDIQGKNLINSARELHNFSEQIILMLDCDKFKIIEPDLNDYICMKYQFYKTDKNNTDIELIEEK